MQMFLLREGILDEKGINQLEKQVDDDLQAAVDRALAGAGAHPGHDLQLYLFAGSRSHLVAFRDAARRAQAEAAQRMARRRLRPRPWPI